MSISILWVLLRILTSIIAAYTSIFRPITSLEMSVPLLPPSTPVFQWLERTLISPWMRWDALWYTKIVTQGYSATDGTAQFHPLYPWLAAPLAKIGISPALSLLIVSDIATIGLFYFFYRFAKIDLAPKDAFFALMILSLAPPAFIFFAPYTEGLFLLLAVLSIYFMRKKSWWLAGIMGGLATLTRQQGILLILPMAWEVWETAGRNFKTLLKLWKAAVGIGLIALGMLFWMAYRAFFINDFAVNYHNVQGFIYSSIISPSAAVVVPDQKFMWPWQAIYLALEKLLAAPDADIWVNLVSAVLFLVILAVSWKKLRMSYRIYSLAITAISFSFFTGSIHPYMGLPRHLMLAFPTMIGFAATVNKVWMRLLIACASVIGLAFLLVLYVLNAWVP